MSMRLEVFSSTFCGSREMRLARVREEELRELLARLAHDERVQVRRIHRADPVDELDREALLRSRIAAASRAPGALAERRDGAARGQKPRAGAEGAKP